MTTKNVKKQRWNGTCFYCNQLATQSTILDFTRNDKQTSLLRSGYDPSKLGRRFLIGRCGSTTKMSLRIGHSYGLACCFSLCMYVCLYVCVIYIYIYSRLCIHFYIHVTYTHTRSYVTKRLAVAIDTQAADRIWDMMLSKSAGLTHWRCSGLIAVMRAISSAHCLIAATSASLLNPIKFFRASASLLIVFNLGKLDSSCT